MAKSIEKPSTFPLRAPETARARSARAPCAFRIARTHLTSLLGNQSFDSSALARTTHAERPVCLVVIWSDAVLVTRGIGFPVHGCGASAGPRNTHLATLRPSAWRSDRSSPRRGDAAMENAIVVSVCTRARHECESARARTLTGDLDDKVSRTRRRSGRLSMNRSHFRTVAMKISRFGFKKQKNTRSNLPQTSRPGTLSADTSFPASSSLERLASRTQKKKSAIGS